METVINFLRYLRELVNDPFGFERHRADMSDYYTSLSESIDDMRAETSKTFDEVIADYKDYAKRQEEKAQFYCMSLENIGDVIPDMLWMKWIDGKYAYTNKAIRDNLLFDEDPLDKDDIFLGNQAVKRFGEDSHDFGKYCAGSDQVVVEYGHRKRFIEYGMAGGRPLVLEVFKNIVRGKDNEIVATVGCGRDVTDNIFTMFKLNEANSDKPEIIGEYLSKYLYENDTIPETLHDFYLRTKEQYYEQY